VLTGLSGYQTVLGLARKNAKVYIGVRSEEKGKAAVEMLKAEKEDAKVDFITMDMMDLKTVVGAVDQLKMCVRPSISAVF
jgi:NAD(P)-dependent dehydrogenase (short-subunit alcohol dehydrogenase family)